MKILDFTPEALNPIPRYEFEEKWSRSFHPSINVPEAKKDLETILSVIKKANQKMLQHDKNMFSYLVENTYELWFTKVNHNITHNFYQWVYRGESGVGVIQNHNDRILFIALNSFYDAAYGKDGETVQRWIERADIFFTFSTYVWGAKRELFEGTFDVETLRAFTKHENRLFTIMNLLERGYTTDVIRFVKLDVLMRFNPEFINRMLTKTDPKVLSQLDSLSTPNRVVTEEVLENLVNVGFTQASEVKNYARRFGIKPTHRDYYALVIKAKTLHPVLPEYEVTL